MPFTERQIELVTTFADQAVIAIENVRLFKEFPQRRRNRGAGISLRRWSNRRRRVKSWASSAGSPTDLQPVLDTIAENAARGYAVPTMR